MASVKHAVRFASAALGDMMSIDSDPYVAQQALVSNTTASLSEASLVLRRRLLLVRLLSLQVDDAAAPGAGGASGLRYYVRRETSYYIVSTLTALMSSTYGPPPTEQSVQAKYDIVVNSLKDLLPAALVPLLSDSGNFLLPLVLTSGGFVRMSPETVRAKLAAHKVVTGAKAGASHQGTKREREGGHTAMEATPAEGASLLPSIAEGAGAAPSSSSL